MIRLDMADKPPTTIAGWRRYLRSYSADYLRTADEAELAETTDWQRAKRWLGAPAASRAQAAAAEARLGLPLPPSLRNFLLVSDGWLAIGSGVARLRTAGDLGWFRDVEREEWNQLRSIAVSLAEHDPQFENPWFVEMLDRCLVLTYGGGDEAHWLLDPADVDQDGEWAGYEMMHGLLTVHDRMPSFAAGVMAARRTFEQIRGAEGRPVHPEGAEELAALGRAMALAGEVEAALAVLERAQTMGSVLAAYLRCLLLAFVSPEPTRETIRNEVVGPDRVRHGVDQLCLRAEMIPLYLRLARDYGTMFLGAYAEFFSELLPELEPDEEPTMPEDELELPYAELRLGGLRLGARAAKYVGPVLPETPAFEQALARARELIAAEDHDSAWAVIETALPDWGSDSPYRIAPVVLLTDPVFRPVVTPDRFLALVTTPRGSGRR